MADLVTHEAAAYLLGRAVRGARPALVVVGGVLPDLLRSLPALVLQQVHVRLHPVPTWALYCWAPMHTPAGFVVVAWALAQLFRPAERRAVIGSVLLGEFLHLLLDLPQDHLGVGIALLYPFSMRPYEWGWTTAEGTVFLAPALAAAALWLARRRPARPPGD